MILKTAFIFIVNFAFAAGGDHQGGVPEVVKHQAINLIILFSAIIYFTKDSVKAFFASRNTEYLDAAKKSASARESAEKELVDIKIKITELDRTRDEVLQKAKLQAEEIKAVSATEAHNLSKRIKEDANLTVHLETQRARVELRTRLLTDSIKAAREVLTKDLGTGDQQKLQKDFINNIGV